MTILTVKRLVEFVVVYAPFLANVHLDVLAAMCLTAPIRARLKVIKG